MEFVGSNNDNDDEDNNRNSPGGVPDLCDARSVLQAVVERVPGQAGHHGQHGQDAAEHGRQHQRLAQPRVTGQTGHVLPEQREGLRPVQESWGNKRNAA